MNKYPTIATVCRYVLEAKKLSNRSVARLLGIHHTTWLRYRNGTSHPRQGIKYKLVRLMRVHNFDALVRKAFTHYYPKGQ